MREEDLLYLQYNVAKRGCSTADRGTLACPEGRAARIRNRRAAECARRMPVKRLLRLKCAPIVIEATGRYETVVVAALQAAALRCR
jgi:hypothetical protein